MTVRPEDARPLSDQQDSCAMCGLIHEIYPKGSAEDESTNAAIRRHFRNQHAALVTPYVVMP